MKNMRLTQIVVALLLGSVLLVGMSCGGDTAEDEAAEPAMDGAEADDSSEEGESEVADSTDEEVGPESGAEPIEWNLTRVPNILPDANVYQITELAWTPVPHRHVTLALDMLIMGSGDIQDYGIASLDEFYEDVKPIMHWVFGATNVFGDGPFGGLFNYYVTDYEYPQATPSGGDCQNLGLPEDWVPDPNEVVDNRPAFNCNFGLSTAGVEFDLGFIVHRQNIQDGNQFNIFSSEYNSYAAILHELSHAGFAISDEAPNSEGHWTKPTHANNYDDLPSCEVVCSSYLGASCEEIENTFYYRCAPPNDGDLQNLMYFDPQPTPGANDGWENYQHIFSASERLQTIYGVCDSGDC